MGSGTCWPNIDQAIGSAVAAYIIGLGGYVAGAASQSSEAVTAIRVAAGVALAALALLAAAVMAPYQLTESRFRQIVADIAGRRAEGRNDSENA
jgi:glucuronide carrier protein